MSHSYSLGFAKVYTSKMPITASDLLYDRVLTFYDALAVPVTPGGLEPQSED